VFRWCRWSGAPWLHWGGAVDLAAGHPFSTHRWRGAVRPQQAGSIKLSAVYQPSVAADPVRPDEHGGPAFFGHDSVVLVPVVMLAAGSDEDLSTELP
jgi:hypothetical protein